MLDQAKQTCGKVPLENMSLSDEQVRQICGKVPLENMSLSDEQVRQICRKVSLENMGESDDSFSEALSGIVYRTDVFKCGDVSIIDRHIDLEYSYGEYIEIHEDASLFQLICTLCNLLLLQEEKEIIIY